MRIKKTNMYNYTIGITFVLLFNLGFSFAKDHSLKSEKKHEENGNEKHEEHGNEKHEEHGSEKHEDHGNEKHEDHGNKKHEEHGNEKHEEHGNKINEHETEEVNTKVGPGKGIVKADKNLGFILSPNAMNNFEIKTIKLKGQGPWSIPLKSRMLSQEEVNLFRIRNQFIKRIDFKIVSSVGISMFVQSADLADGDEVIINGMGFIRIAELAAFGGAPEGHSH